MGPQLTKEADYLISLLYKSYLEKRKNGISKFQSKHTGSSSEILDNILPKWEFDDVDETCRELCRANMLQGQFASDVMVDSFLTDNAIIYMENRFKNGLNSVIEHISKIKSAIPFL